MGLQLQLLRIAAWVGLSLVAQPLFARAPTAAFMMRGGEVGAPRGFLDMCQTTIDFCTPARERTAVAILPSNHVGKTAVASDSRSLLAAPVASDWLKMLNRANRYVNSRVKQRTDFQIYGREEVWQRSGLGPHAQGDCEDIALEKRYLLIAEGFPADRLFFAEVYSREAGLHAILVAHTDAGDYALDNRTPYVRLWHEAGYSWISVQSVEDPIVWHRVA